MPKFQMHAPSHILQLQHRTAPGGSRNRNLHRFRTKLRMSRKQSLAATQQHSRVTMMHGLNLEHGGGWQIVQKNATFDFRLNNAAVDFVRQVRVRVKHTVVDIRVSGFAPQNKSPYGSGPMRKVTPLDGRTYPQVAGNMPA